MNHKPSPVTTCREPATGEPGGSGQRVMPAGATPEEFEDVLRSDKACGEPLRMATEAPDASSERRRQGSAGHQRGSAGAEPPCAAAAAAPAPPAAALYPLSLLLSPPEVEAAFWGQSPVVCALDRGGLALGTFQLVRAWGRGRDGGGVL
jgi:hypothetical protein